MIVPSYFSNLASSQNLQFLIDSDAINLEMQSVWRNYLTMGLPQLNLTFDAAIGRERIAAMASIVDINSPAPLRSRKTLELYKGKIPAIKEMFAMNQDDMRTLEILRALPITAGGSATAMIDFLNSDLAEASVSGDKRVDYMLMQQMSTLKVDVSVTNNPDGVATGVIDLLSQPYQTQGVPVVWTDAANAKPIDDIEKYVQNLWNKYGKMFGVIRMNYDTWLDFKNTAQVKDMLKSYFNIGKTNGTFAVTLENINDYFVSNKWPEIEIIKHLSHIEKDGAPTYDQGFKTGMVSFMPAGKIGKLYNGISMEELHKVANKSYAKFGATLVSKWAESNPLTEMTAMEMLAFPMVNVDDIFLLDTRTVGTLGLS